MAGDNLAKLARELKPRRQRGRELPVLILVTDRRRQGEVAPLLTQLSPGDAVLLRDYDAPDRGAIARRLARLCRRRRLRLLVAGDSRLARRFGSGLHLAEARLRRVGRLRRPRRGFLLSAAAHGRAALARARRAGADLVLLSPVFATHSHEHARPLGAVRFAALARRAPLAVYALGGIDERSARRLKASGASGIAAIGAFSGAASML